MGFFQHSNTWYSIRFQCLIIYVYVIISPCTTTGTQCCMWPGICTLTLFPVWQTRNESSQYGLNTGFKCDKWGKSEIYRQIDVGNLLGLNFFLALGSRTYTNPSCSFFDFFNSLLIRQQIIHKNGENAISLHNFENNYPRVMKFSINMYLHTINKLIFPKILLNIIY